MEKTKKRMLHRLMCGICFFLTTVFAFSQTDLNRSGYLDLGIDPNILDELMHKGHIERSYYKEKDMAPSLCFDTELGVDILNAWTAEDEPVFISESLFILEKPEDSTDTNDIPLVSKVLRSFSTMEGIQYFSNSNEKTETLYERVYTIDNPKDMNKIPDQTEELVENTTLYMFQDDNSFGETVYKVDISQHDNEISMVLRNETPIKFSFITAVKKNNTVMSFLIVDEGDYLISYILARVDFPAISLFESRVNDSFASRISALYEWFKKSYLDAKRKL